MTDGGGNTAVVILGAGPVAMALAGALATAGRPPAGLWARRAEAAKRAGEFAGIPYFSGTVWPAAVRDAEVLVLAVRDEAIAPLAKQLEADGVPTGTQVLLHCAGSLAAETAFADVRSRGMGLLHPLRAIVDPAESAKSLATTTFGIEGDTVGKAVAEELAVALGAPVLRLRAEQMAAYHASAAIASNYLVALMEVAEGVLEAAGIAGTDARAALLDLGQGSLDNLRREGLPEALTGPIRRGDAATVAAHIHALQVGPTETLVLYQLLGRRCLALARLCGDAPDAKLLEINELFGVTPDADPAGE